MLARTSDIMNSPRTITSITSSDDLFGASSRCCATLARASVEGGAVVPKTKQAAPTKQLSSWWSTIKAKTNLNPSGGSKKPLPFLQRDMDNGQTHRRVLSKRSQTAPHVQQGLLGENLRKPIPSHNSTTTASTKTMKLDNDQERRRSSPIAIHRSRSKPIGSSAAAHSICSSEDQQMYDWATWQMFHRISEYRRRHPISYNPVASVSAEGRGDESYLKDNDRCDDGRPFHLNHRQQDDVYDGEIFDLEL